jgi:hypothetical protein
MKTRQKEMSCLKRGGLKPQGQEYMENLDEKCKEITCRAPRASQGGDVRKTPEHVIGFNPLYTTPTVEILWYSCNRRNKKVSMSEIDTQWIKFDTQDDNNCHRSGPLFPDRSRKYINYKKLSIQDFFKYMAYILQPLSRASKKGCFSAQSKPGETWGRRATGLREGDILLILCPPSRQRKIFSSGIFYFSKSKIKNYFERGIKDDLKSLEKIR